MNIDVYDIDSELSLIDAISTSKTPKLFYMPNLNYNGMEKYESWARHLQIPFKTIPVTLPVMDIVSQLQHEGIDVDETIVDCVAEGVRDTIMIALDLKECMEEEIKDDVGGTDGKTERVQGEDDVLG